MDFLEELEEKKKEILKIASEEEKLFYCFFMDFKDYLCNELLKEGFKEKEKVIYKLIKHDKLDISNSEQIVKQIVKNKNSLEGAAVYILFYKKKDVRNFNLSFLEFFLLKEKFPDLKANFSQIPYEQEKKQALVKLTNSMIKNEKFEKDLLFSALREVRTLYDILILEKSYLFHISKAIELDTVFVKSRILEIFNLYKRVKFFIKVLSFFIFVGFIFLINHYCFKYDFSYTNLKTFYKNFETFSGLISLIIFILGSIYFVFIRKPNEKDNFHQKILNTISIKRENFFDFITILILNHIFNFNIKKEDIKNLEKLIY